MTDETQGQVPNVSGQVPQINQQDSALAGAQTGQEPETERFDAEYVRKLRAEAAEYRKRLRELEQTVKQHEEAKMSEVERLRARLSELEAAQHQWELSRQETTLRYETMLQASRLGIVDPEAAYRLLDASAVEFDEDGRPQNLDKLLKKLIQERPYLVGATLAPTNPAAGPSRSGVFTREQIKDRRFWEAHRDEILRAMAEGRITD